MKLSEYSEKWINSIGMLKKPATQASMLSHVRKMDEFFGETNLETITEDLTQRYISSLFNDLNPRTVRMYWGTMKLILKRAQKEGLVEFVPDPVLPKGGQKPQLYFSLEELKSLSRLGLLYFLLSETGVRVGEALGLQNSDIDLKNKTLTVNRSVFNGKAQAPKTANAFRTISISDRLCREIRGRLQDSPGFLFHSRSGGPYFQGNVLRKLHKDSGKLIGFHAFRRGNASALAELGCPIKTISYRQGRSTGNLTVDSYIYYKSQSDREWAEKLGDILINGG